MKQEPPFLEKRTKQNKSLKINYYAASTMQFVLKRDLFRVWCKGNLALRLFVIDEPAFRPSFKSEPVSKDSLVFVKLKRFRSTAAGWKKGKALFFFVVCRTKQCLFKGNLGNLTWNIQKNYCLLWRFSLFSHIFKKTEELGQRAIIYQFLIKIGGRK